MQASFSSREKGGRAKDSETWGLPPYSDLHHYDDQNSRSEKDTNAWNPPAS